MKIVNSGVTGRASSAPTPLRRAVELGDEIV
jgi:hypothetical protein